MNNPLFTIYPAIDLRQGQVVRLKMGDPSRQTTYSDDPAQTAHRWLSAGATWLHVINLDGAFDEPDSKNQTALKQIVSVAQSYGAKVQFGGGIRSSASVEQALTFGVNRVIMGTVVVENRKILEDALTQWGPESIAAGLDARDGLMQVRGWKEGTQLRATDLAQELQSAGLRWMIYTDIAQDGMGHGINLEQTVALANACELNIIASGGANSLDDVTKVHQAGLAGVIIGQALYSGRINETELFTQTLNSGE